MLRPRKVRPFFGRHPWVLETAIADVQGDPADGDVVDLHSDRGQWIARGCYNRHSRIRVRLYSWEANELLDTAFWSRRLATAIELRRQLGYLTPGGGSRLVFSEADGLSGLLVDRFGDFVVVQATALAMARRLDEWIPLLREQIGYRGLLLKTDRDMSRAEGITLEDGLLDGAATGRAHIHRRARVAIRSGPGRRAKDRLLSRSTRQSPGSRRLLCRPPGARPVLL